MKRTQRSVDYDGLDGILQLPETTKEAPKWYQVPWLYALVVTGLLAAFLLYDQKQPTPPQTLSVQTNTSVTPLTAKDNPTLDSSDTAAKDSEQRIDSPQTDSPPDHQESATSAEDVSKQQTVGLEQSTAPFQIEVPAETSSGILFTVHFNFNSSNLNLLGNSEKNDLIHAAKNCPGLIALTGHTCNMGSAAVNKYMGLARANSVKAFLSANGIPVQKIAIASEGMDSPAVPNDTPTLAAKNRRVELICRDR